MSKTSRRPNRPSPKTTPGKSSPVMSVSARVEKTTLPVFEISRGLPTPSVFELEENKTAYPRTMLDVGTRARKPATRDYTLLVLESDLLRVEVLPEVGGHVWRMVDKRTGRNLLWTNDCVKPVDAGRRRGYLVGGIEFPFPMSNHGEDNLEPYRWATRRNPDGSATITVSTFDHFYRFWGSYDVTVRPGDPRIAITMRLHNPTFVRNRYQIWVNGAVPAGKDAQFIFPVDHIAGHGYAGIHPWPMWDDGKLDRSFWKNQREALGIFGWDRDFLGVWYHSRNVGTLRWCDHNLAEGIKAWTWGTDSYWTGEYTIRQGHSVEIQWGRWPTQDMYGWLEPHETDSWTEYWFPLHGLGGVDAASKDAAMSVLFSPARAPRTAEVRVNVLREVTGTLTVKLDSATLLRKEVSAGVSDLITERVPLKGASSKSRLHVTLTDSSGAVVVSCEKPLRQKSGPPPEEPKSIRLEGAGPLWQKLESALSRELLDGNLARAREEYEALVRVSPDFAPAWKALGILRYKQLDLAAARDALSKALDLAPADDEARYYLGLTALELADPAALDVLAAVSDKSPLAGAASVRIARELIRRADYASAIARLKGVTHAAPRNFVALDTLAVASRLAGDRDAARAAVAKALAAEPLDPYAMTESLVLSGKLSRRDVTAALGPDVDLYAEVALFYESFGDTATAFEVARASEPLASSALDFYYLAYFAARAGDESAARAFAAKADKFGTDYSFPHRREDIAILDVAAGYAPHPAYAKYQQSALLYWLGRQDEALSNWTDLIGRYEVPGLARTVADACARGKVSLALDGTINLYRKALDENPKDAAAYCALDDLYERAANIHDRRDSLEKARKMVPSDDEVAIRMARCYSQRTMYRKAATVLESHRFRRTHQSRLLAIMAVRTIELTYSGLAMEARRKGAKAKALAFLKRASSAAETVKKWFD
jgi:tetratricopeptide (TPR) repeat protein